MGSEPWDPRLTASVTLGAVMLALIMTKTAVLERRAAEPPAPQVAPVRIVDPAFCQNQTWPYIDQRCLKRADAPDSSVAGTARGAGTPTAPQPAALSAPPPQPSAPSVPAPANSAVAMPPTASPPQAAVDHTQPTLPSAGDFGTNRTGAMARDEQQASAESFWPNLPADDAKVESRRQHMRHARHHRYFFGFHF